MLITIPKIGTARYKQIIKRINRKKDNTWIVCDIYRMQSHKNPPLIVFANAMAKEHFSLRTPVESSPIRAMQAQRHSISGVEDARSCRDELK